MLTKEPVLEVENNATVWMFKGLTISKLDKELQKHPQKTGATFDKRKPSQQA